MRTSGIIGLSTSDPYKAAPGAQPSLRRYNANVLAGRVRERSTNALLSLKESSMDEAAPSPAADRSFVAPGCAAIACTATSNLDEACFPHVRAVDGAMPFFTGPPREDGGLL